jgi:outer membrane protein OmpA-like peptidoglycan-associated protein
MNTILKKCFFFLTFTLQAWLTNAQNIWYKDDFSETNWYVSKEGNMKYYYENEKYVLENRKTSQGSFSWVYQSIFTDTEKDFNLEVEMSFEDSYDDKHGAGLLVGTSDGKSIFITINPTQGKFYIGSYKKGESTKDILIHKEEPAIKKGLNVVNKLEFGMKAATKMVYIKINGQEVFSENKNLTFDKIYGSYGFCSANNSKCFFDNLIFRQDNKINVLPGMEAKLTLENLGDKINTQYAEKAPLIAPDGKTLYYSIDSHPENTGGTKDSDEIWYAESKDGETWGEKKRMGKPLNNAGNNCVISSSPDNNTLLLMHKYKPDGEPGGSGFSITHRTADGWEVPQDIDMEDYKSNGQVSFCMSADRKALIMSVVRDENLGMHDLWVSFHLKDNQWSKPMNLGKDINTEADEITPFLAADGVSLYFSTNGLPGYGGQDIFVSRRLDDTWTKWSTPQNLGNSINSKGWDAYYRLPASGKYAYMTNDSKGNLDIVRIKLPQAAKPKPVILVSGKVYNSKTKEPLSANISYNNLKTDKELGIAISNPKDGSYKIVLPAGNNYGFLASKETFISVSENIDASKITEYKEITRDLYLSPIEVGQVIRLNNIFFDTGKFDLRPESYGDLNRLIKVLEENPNMTILVAGHTDNVGVPQANLELSKNRAKAVRDYLIKKGIKAERLTFDGFGANKPTDTNATEAGKQRNRRVEFTIQSN